MSITRSITHCVALVAAAFGGPAVLAAGDAVAASAAALPVPHCTTLDPARLHVTVSTRGVVHLHYSDDGVFTCNEVLQIRSWASAGPTVDNHHDRLIDEEIVWVADLEAAGKYGLDRTITLDPCWAGVEIHRDGDSLVFSHVLGNGCSFTVRSRFVGESYDVLIIVSQDTGGLAQQNVFSLSGGEDLVLPRRPSGSWTVTAAGAGWLGGSISVNGDTPTFEPTRTDIPATATVEVVLGPLVKPPPH
jgi:hypothetical protein